MLDPTAKATEAILKSSTRVRLIFLIQFLITDLKEDGSIDIKMVQFKEYCYDKRIRKSYFA